MRVGERVERALFKREMTQRALAEAVNTVPQSISHLIAGRRHGSDAMLKKIAAVLDLDAELLLMEAGLACAPSHKRYRRALMIQADRQARGLDGAAPVSAGTAG